MQKSKIINQISADRPQSDPKGDLFGHAAFARTLADAVSGQIGSDSLVLSLYGPWGSGKSTVLSYVQHFLESEPADTRPVVVAFNPWWFSGQENLARAFLGQLQAVLPAKYEGFKALGERLAEFSEAIGGVVDLIGAATGVHGAGEVARAGARMLAHKPRDVPGLKKVLADLLLEQRKRVVVVVDDIDRLAPEEVRQLFTVIKALADFPYVTYLLAFDREVAVMAISEQMGMPGDRYLEKIIQVPFELPQVEREALFRALFAKLDAVLDPMMPEGRFDSEYWNNVFHSGLGALFQVPRDVVRLTNTLSVTYPAVAREVNPVDFIAIECLRVFLPDVYRTVRDSAQQFVGHQAPRDGSDKQRALAFHEAWLQKVAEPLREQVKALMQRLFPRLESVWSNMHYSGDSAVEWRRECRVCSPELLSAYFRLSLPQGVVGREELDAVLGLRQDPPAFASALLEAAKHRRPDGVSKVRELLGRVMDHVPTDFVAADATPVIQALMNVGDDLVLPGDRLRGEFDFGNESRVCRIIYHLLKKVEAGNRVPLLMQTLSKGRSLRCSQFLFANLVEETEKAAKHGGTALISASEAGDLKAAWVRRVEEMAIGPEFIEHPSLATLLSGWFEWGGEERASEWWSTASAPDEGLIRLIEAHKWESVSQTVGDFAVRVQVRVNPKALERYGDVHAMAERVSKLLHEGKVAEQWRPAASQFVRECEMLKEGSKRPVNPS